MVDSLVYDPWYLARNWVILVWDEQLIVAATNRGNHSLANRGYINRNGRDISYEEIAQASREIFNFGDDNVNPNPNPTTT